MFPDNFVQLRPASSSKPPAPAPEAAPAPVPSEHHNADVRGREMLRCRDELWSCTKVYPGFHVDVCSYLVRVGNNV